MLSNIILFLELFLKKIITACISCIYIVLFTSSAFAKTSLELLNEPSFESHLANKSVLLNLIKHSDNYVAVGERGHIIRWTSAQKWYQDKVPVSVSITAIAPLNNGNLIAVGHDAVILVYEQKNQSWRKVFDGYQLTDLLIRSLNKQIIVQQQKIENLPTDADAYDEEYYLEDLQFALEDAQKELPDGPNKPLLSVITANNGDVFAVGAYGILLQSKNSGESWELVSNRLENLDKYHLNAISKDTNGNLFIVGENAVAAKSSDNGKSWEPMQLPYQGSFFGIETAPNSPHLVAYGLQGHIAVSPDSGTSWVLLPKKLSISFLGGVIGDNNQVYLVGHGGLIVSFSLFAPESQNIYKHPSGNVLTAIALEGDKQFVLAGQSGIQRWTVGN